MRCVRGHTMRLDTIAEIFSGIRSLSSGRATDIKSSSAKRALRPALKLLGRDSHMEVGTMGSQKESREGGLHCD